ncbi:MAG: hypothetical protein LBF21_02210 [Puniceicoccales bacterium]|jgi:hypothetical protein|nr:hypothetical protein [Puniceicoccales bacterium]
MGFWLSREKFVLLGNASCFAVVRWVKKLGTWRVARIWGQELRTHGEEEWLRVFDAWVKKLPLHVRQQVHSVIVPSEAVAFRQLDIPAVTKLHYQEAIDFELQRSMREANGETEKWLPGFVSAFVKEKENDLPCFALRQDFLERWLEILARRYVVVRHVFVDSLLALLRFEQASCKDPTLFVYAGAHVITLCFQEGKKTRMSTLPYEHLELLKSFRAIAPASEGEVPDDTRVVQEILAADPTTAAGACGAQAQQQLHAKLKQAELALYREASGKEYHQAVLGAYHSSAYAFVQKVLADAGKSVIPVSEHFKFSYERRVPEEMKALLEPSLIAAYGVTSTTNRRKGSAFFKDMIPSSWKADYFFTRCKAWILALVLITSILLFGEMSLLQSENKSAQHEVGLLKAFQQEAVQVEKAIAAAKEQIATRRKDADRIRSLVNHQDAWLKFFNGLREQAAKAQTLWFDEWDWKLEAASPQITMRGSMLTNEALGQPNTDRQMAQFLQDMQQVPFVKELQNIKLFMKDECTVAFSFDLLLRKETPLIL